MKKIQLKSTRDGFGEGIIEAGERNEKVIVLTADLKDSTRVVDFQKRFPKRFFDIGVAEQALVTVASGMANYGKIPFATSFSIFSPGRNWEQIRTTVCLNNVPVKIVGSHSGLSASSDGGSHQALEDIAMMRTLPNMEVVSPCDFEETKKAVMAIAETKNPAYLRLSRMDSPAVTSKDTPFKLGKINTVHEDKNPKVAIIATGPILFEALKAAEQLKKTKYIGSIVLNCHTIKPIDEQEIVHAAKIAGAVVVVEEHQIAGGLGSLVSEILAKNFPIPVEFVGVKDAFGESGTYQELLEKHKLTAKYIEQSVKVAIQRKES